MPRPTTKTDNGNGVKSQKGKNVQQEKNDGGQEAIVGTSDADNLIGTAGDDWILGGDGDDTLTGGTGHNQMDGGEGSDTYLVYGFGSVMTVNDTGTEGHDVVAAGTSSTVIGMTDFGPDSGIEEITSGGHAMVEIQGTAYGDSLDFSETEVNGISKIHGMGGNDTIVGSASDDRLLGGSGDDNLTGGDGSDSLNGGLGADTFTLTADDTGIDAIEDFRVGDGDQVDLTAYAADETVVGWEAVDETPDDGVDNPILRVLYDGGQSKDVAILEGVSDEEMSGQDFEDAILLF